MSTTVQCLSVPCVVVSTTQDANPQRCPRCGSPNIARVPEQSTSTFDTAFFRSGSPGVIPGGGGLT